MKILCTTLTLMSLATPAFAADARFVASLGKLDPQTRLEQICDYEAMSQIGKGGNAFHPDRAKSDVVSPPKHQGDTLIAKGAARFAAAANGTRSPSPARRSRTTPACCPSPIRSAR